MRRRDFLTLVIGASAGFLLSADLAAGGVNVRAHHPIADRDWDLGSLDRDPAFWRDYVSDAAWDILFRDGTERPYSSPLDDFYEDGTYVCAACYLPLFSSAAKYDSRTGWPSFFQPFDGHLGTRPDHKLWATRTEYHCTRCKGHQGHVFNDGPDPTGERWCNNGLALHFVPAQKSLPQLRG